MSSAKETIEWINTWPIIAILIAIMLVTVCTTIYLFIWKMKDERPNFVITQMVFLNFYWMIYFVSFFGFLLPIMRRGDGEDNYTGSGLENTMATMGDVCLMIHDWIYTEQYLEAALLFPIAIEQQLTSQSELLSLSDSSKS